MIVNKTGFSFYSCMIRLRQPFKHYRDQKGGQQVRIIKAAGAAGSAIMLILLMLVATNGLLAGAALADLKVCNATTSRVGVAIGYKDKVGWATEGWWNIPSNTCETLLKGNLIARYYYIHAIDYDRGGDWSGKAFMCTSDKSFTIRGVLDCVKRGYRRTGFYEIDTTEENDWTVRLVDPAEAAPSENTVPR